MSEMISWIAAEAEGVIRGNDEESRQRTQRDTKESPEKNHISGTNDYERVDNPHRVSAKNAGTRVGQRRIEDFEDFENSRLSQHRGDVGYPQEESQNPQFWQNRPEVEQPWFDEEQERERRIYRGRTVAMLRRYMRYSLDTGRLPSLLGREFFRARVTKYTVVTFEDRVIFVHDMERCLERLDKFSRQLIARHILQEHDLWATARLLRCNERTVRRLTPVALDLLNDILLEVGLMEPLGLRRENSCQGGAEDEIFLSDCEYGKNKFL